MFGIAVSVQLLSINNYFFPPHVSDIFTLVNNCLLHVLQNLKGSFLFISLL